MKDGGWGHAMETPVSFQVIMLRCFKNRVFVCVWGGGGGNVWGGEEGGYFGMIINLIFENYLNCFCFLLFVLFCFFFCFVYFFSIVFIVFVNQFV